MLVDKQTYSKNHYYQENNLNQTFFSIFFFIFVSKKTLTRLSVAKFACFNTVSNIVPAKLLNSGAVS